MRIIMFLICFFVVSANQVFANSMEWNTDRPGLDFSNFNLQKADPKLCQQRCQGNAKCKAWTYVRPHTIQGPNPRCWLKHAVPKAKKNSCCVSGVKKTVTPPSGSLEWNTDRPGMDFSNFNLSSANPNLCKARCQSSPKCKAWTYVRPHTTQGPHPRCWLKHSVPKAKQDSCCVSGVKKTVAPPSGSLEWNTDRPGMDFSNFNLSSANPNLCKARCESSPKCKAWTYVRPHTTQGPHPRCWLKHSVPKAKKDSCCVSGVR